MKIKIIKTIILPNHTYTAGEIHDVENCMTEEGKISFTNLHKMLVELEYAIEIKENLYKNNGKNIICASCITPLGNNEHDCNKCKFRNNSDKDLIEIINKFEEFINKK